MVETFEPKTEDKDKKPVKSINKEATNKLAEIRREYNGEVRPTIRKGEKRREVMTYFWAGIMVCFDVMVFIFCMIYREYIFTIAGVDWSRTLEVGLVLARVVGLVIVLAFNVRTVKSILREWNRYEYLKIKPKEEAGEKLKRVNFIRKWWFNWRVWEARAVLDKFNGVMLKLERKVGKIRGNETKELTKLKREMILQILLWREDFAVVRHDNSTEIVSKEYLETLSLKELYEMYLLKCVDSAERFINGVAQEEIIEEI